MKRIALLSMLCVLAIGARGQHVLQAEGEMPRDLRMGFEQMYEVDKQRVKDFDNGKLRNKNDVQAASYAVNSLLTSGRVLYGDPLTLWVNRIADSLLVNEPELRKELRFYVVKSPAVNAYATGQGIIFVNIGLIAQLEDEAQLAYILSHEIVHYQRKHTLQELTRNKRAEAELGRNDEMAALMRKHNRSKEMENEADSLGILQFYLPSAYRKDVCEGVFDVLQYAYLPFDEIPFDTNYFNTAHFRLPSELWLKELNPITARDDYDDSRSTHPNILKRRQLVQGLFDLYEGNPRQEGFLCATAKEFRELRDMARYEVMRQHLLDFNYARALYEIYLLELEHPEDSLYLQQCKAQTLYSMARYRNHSKAVNHPIPNIEEIEGEQQQVYHMLREISKEHLTILALREEARLGNRREMEELMRDLTGPCGLSATDFLATYDTAAPAPAQDTAAGTSSKYSRIRRKKAESRQVNPIAYAFEGQPELLRRMRELAATPEDTTRPALRSDKVLMLDPTYLVYDARKEQMNYPKSVSQESRLEDMDRAVLRANGQELVTIGWGGDEAGLAATLTYNDYMALTDYMNELASCIDDYDQLLFTQARTNQVLDRLGVDQIQLLVVGNIEGLRTNNAFWYVWGLFLPVIYPVTIYSLIEDHEQTLIGIWNIDARSGRLISKKNISSHFRDNDALLKGHLYAAQREATRPDSKPAGYMGSHLMVGADLQANINPLSFDYWSPEGIFPARLSVTPTLEYFYRPDRALHLSWNLRRSDITYETGHWNSDGGYYGSGVWEYDTVTTDVALHHFTLGITRFKPGCIAPYGPYLTLGATASLYKLTDRDTQESTLIPKLGFSMEVGRNRIVRDRLVLRVGGGITLTAAAPFSFFEGESATNPTIGDTPLNTMAWLDNVVFLKVGLGVLPF